MGEKHVIVYHAISDMKACTDGILGCLLLKEAIDKCESSSFRKVKYVYGVTKLQDLEIEKDELVHFVDVLPSLEEIRSMGKDASVGYVIDHHAENKDVFRALADLGGRVFYDPNICATKIIYRMFFAKDTAAKSDLLATIIDVVDDLEYMRDFRNIGFSTVRDVADTMMMKYGSEAANMVKRLAARKDETFPFCLYSAVDLCNYQKCYSVGKCLEKIVHTLMRIMVTWFDEKDTYQGSAYDDEDDVCKKYVVQGYAGPLTLWKLGPRDDIPQRAKQIKVVSEMKSNLFVMVRPIREIDDFIHISIVTKGEKDNADRLVKRVISKLNEDGLGKHVKGGGGRMRCGALQVKETLLDSVIDILGQM